MKITQHQGYTFSHRFIVKYVSLERNEVIDCGVCDFTQCVCGCVCMVKVTITSKCPFLSVSAD